jgi:hypothetical protein
MCHESIGVRGFQRVVANRAACRHPGMNRGGPALQSVMPGAMEDVGNADGGRRSRRFDSRKQRMVIHDGVGQKNFIDTTAAQIECRSIVKRAPRSDAREQPIVLAIPKTMLAAHKRFGGRRSLGRFLLIRGRVATTNWLRGRRSVWIPAFGRLLLCPKRGHARKKEKYTSRRAPHPFPHRNTSGPFVSRIGRKDCGQARKGCKGGKKISAGNFVPMRAEQRAACGSLRNHTTRYCIFSLDTTIVAAQNPRNFFRAWLVRGIRSGSPQAEKLARHSRGRKSVQYLPGWTVQCINPECAARGHWLRASDSHGEFCSNCSSPLHNVPPPISPRLRMRPRSLGSYRPPGRSPGRQR